MYDARSEKHHVTVARAGQVKCCLVTARKPFVHASIFQLLSKLTGDLVTFAFAV